MPLCDEKPVLVPLVGRFAPDPRLLSEIGVPLECKRRIAEKAMLDSATGTNPRATTVEEMEELTEIAISGAR